MSSITKNWTKEDFRKELEKIDRYVEQTQGIRLNGASFGIELSMSRSTLGAHYPEERKFRFSLPFFNSDVPEECAVDVIRHEYAHYYNQAVFGISHGHGAQFKVACGIVGANPDRYYSKVYEDLARKKEEWEAREYKSILKTGQRIRHPFFGSGVITDIQNRKDSALLTVDFERYGTMIIDEVWLRNKGAI